MIQTVTTGFWIERYIILLLALMVSLWLLFIIRFLKNSHYHPSRPLLILHTFLILIFFILILTLIAPKPKLISPQLPLFEPILVSNNNPFILSFDRPISPATRISLIPHVEGTWHFAHKKSLLSINSLVFTPDEPLDPNIEYQIQIDRYSLLPFSNADTTMFIFTPIDNKMAHSISKEFNLIEPVKAIDFQEKTSTATDPAILENIESFQLNIPLYKQTYNFTCFSIAAKMVLAYRGIEDISETGFLNEIGFDTTPRNQITNTWGDPNKGIVGSIDGSGDGGYGVHWDPFAHALSKYRPVEVKRNWNVSALLSTVRAGNPVLVWWVNGAWPAYETSWNNSSGDRVYTVNGMHVEVVTGWEGDISNPRYITTNDPWRGKRKYTPEQFMNLWKWFDQTGVVVY